MAQAKRPTANGLEDRMYQAIVLAFDGEAEAWNLSTDSGDRLARVAARAAAKVAKRHG